MSAEIPGRCNEPGPWGTICTDYPGHVYSHYDASDGASWQDDWREEVPPAGGGTYDELDE